VFRLTSGEREALITNPDKGEVEDTAFPELYYKRRPIETKYNQVKQKFEKRKLQRVAGREYQAGFLRDDDGIEYAFRRTEGSGQRDKPAVCCASRIKP
jgi:hypothetical protein